MDYRRYFNFKDKSFKILKCLKIFFCLFHNIQSIFHMIPNGDVKFLFFFQEFRVVLEWISGVFTSVKCFRFVGVCAKFFQEVITQETFGIALSFMGLVSISNEAIFVYFKVLDPFSCECFIYQAVDGSPVWFVGTRGLFQVFFPCFFIFTNFVQYCGDVIEFGCLHKVICTGFQQLASALIIKISLSNGFLLQFT